MMKSFDSKETLRADDGSVLPVKEGVVLAQDGTIVSGTANTREDFNNPFGGQFGGQFGRNGTFRVVRVGGGSGLGGALGFLLLPLALMAGVTTLGVVLAVIFALWLLWTLLRPVLRLISR